MGSSHSKKRNIFGKESRVEISCPDSTPVSGASGADGETTLKWYHGAIKAYNAKTNKYKLTWKVDKEWQRQIYVSADQLHLARCREEDLEVEEKTCCVIYDCRAESGSGELLAPSTTESD